MIETLINQETINHNRLIESLRFSDLYDCVNKIYVDQNIKRYNHAKISYNDCIDLILQIYDSEIANIVCILIFIQDTEIAEINIKKVQSDGRITTIITAFGENWRGLFDPSISFDSSYVKDMNELSPFDERGDQLVAILTDFIYRYSDLSDERSDDATRDKCNTIIQRIVGDSGSH